MSAGWQAPARLAIGVLALATGALGSCASPGLPPGGPPDEDEPRIMRISPDSNAVNVRASAVLVHFDEVISERPTARAGLRPGSGGAGGSELVGVASLSPSDGREQVRWRRTSLEIRPRRGFRPNTAYRVIIHPGITDLRGNAMREPTEFVFSTGAEIPQGEVTGVLFDWEAGRHAPLAEVAVFTPDDTTFRWTARADSLGRFRVRDLMPGTYELRAWVDGNNNRTLDFREAFDSATVRLEREVAVELYAFVRDTLPTRIEAIEPLDSTALRVRFERAVQADWDASGHVELLDANSTAIALGGVMIPSERHDSLLRSARAEADAAEADTLAVEAPPADVAPRDTTIATETPAARAPEAIAADPVVLRAERDSVPPPVFRRLKPETQWTVPLRAALPPGSYTLRVIGAPGLNGVQGEGSRDFVIRDYPAPAAASDSVAADSTAPPDAERIPPRSQ